MDDLMDKTGYGQAALRKFGAVPENFHVYSCEWLGKTPGEWDRMRVTGAQFNGKRKVVGTTMSTIVTLDEIRAFTKRSDCDDAPATPLMTADGQHMGCKSP